MSPVVGGGGVTVRVAIPGHRNFPEIYLPDESRTVADLFAQLERRGFDYNGTPIEVVANGVPVQPDDNVTQLNHLDAVIIVPDKPTGN